ncbi:MAG TPA: energy transducer TonB [Opitutus sp.]|nr:energy transducer TonB [Opitutus sp.]
MNSRAFLLIPALVCAATVPAVSAQTAGYTPMKIIQTETPIFPLRVNELGVTAGEARVTISVDEKGKLTDALVTAYSHPAFADSAVAALKQWRYEPAWVGGQPVGAIMDLTFNFERQGLVVVDMTVSSYVEMRNYQLRPSAYSYKVGTLQQLDRIPTPTKVVRPLYPIEPSKPPQAASVTVNFFIDEKGHVRMPAVSRETSESLGAFAAAAVEAVSQWEFEPPMSHGVPVLVAARQDFNFNPGPATPEALND